MEGQEGRAEVQVLPGGAVLGGVGALKAGECVVLSREEHSLDRENLGSASHFCSALAESPG